MEKNENNAGGSLNPKNLSLKKYIRTYKSLGNHVKRYNFVKKMIGKVDYIIELGCGHGAGSIFLQGAYKKYLGIDIDTKAIKYAKLNIETKYSDTIFMTLDEFQNSKDSLIETKADAVVCFEVFEHVKDINWLLSFLLSITKDHGQIFISTPNGLSSNGDKALFRSDLHIYEYNAQELYNILNKYANVKLFGEVRYDRMDVKLLLNRESKAIHDHNNIDINNNRIAFGTSLFFNFATKYLNGSIFWKIYETNTTSETELNSSTLIALLKK